MINLRGEIIPIYSLRKKFGMEDSTGEGQFIIVRIGEMPLALEVDGVGEIYQADDSSVYETPKIVISKDTRYVEKVINANGRLIIMININMLLNDDEKSGIEGLIEAHK